MQFFSEEQKHLVNDTLRQNKGDVSLTAKQLGMSESQINWVDVIVNGKLKYIEGKGNPKLQPYIIAIRDRRFESFWDNTNPKISLARQLYDEGKVEMVTGFDGNNIILYAIPRRFQEPSRQPYFSYIEKDF